MGRLTFLTGRPGIGKTSILLRTIEILKTEGYNVGGMVSREFRERGVRTGFEIVDLRTEKRGWLAHVKAIGPRFGRYRINLSGLNHIGAESILQAVEKAEVIVVDEIGPMELFSFAFKDAVMKGIKSEKPLIGTMHYRVCDPLITTIKAEKNAKIIEVTNKNRKFLHAIVARRVREFMQRA